MIFSVEGNLKAQWGHCMLEQFPIFASLEKEYLSQLEGITRQILAKKGSILFAPGDATQGFYAVHDGAVRVYRVSSGGKEITQQIAGTRSTFAGASLFSDIYNCYAEALKDSTVYLIRKDAFLEMIQKDSQFAATWIRILSLEIIHLCHRIEELSIKSPKARIASYFILLSEIQNTSTIKLPVHRKAIATLLGMTHETFYRKTKNLENERIVRFDKKRVAILNRPLLEELME